MKNKTSIYFVFIFILFSVYGTNKSIAGKELRENSKTNIRPNLVSEISGMEALQGQATVVTNQAKNITSTAATAGYTINANGVKITAHGICLSKSAGPTIANTKYAADKSPGPSFNVQLTGLTPNMKFYFRSYITTSAGTIYGNEFSVTTLPAKK